MECWHDMMNWPLTPGWKCEICGYDPPWGTGLTWGLVNGVCRCDQCHVEYTMKREGEVLTTPFCLLKPEYRAAFERIWAEHQTPVDEVTDAMWDRYLSAAELPTV
jgi:hypothetical protein